MVPAVPVTVPVAEAAAATDELSLPTTNTTRDADAQELDSLEDDTCRTSFSGGASSLTASVLAAVERATAVAVRLITPHKDLPVDPVVTSATLLKLRALVWPVADRPDVMNIFSRALCTALRSEGGAPVLALPANVVALLLSAMVLPVTHPDSWKTGAQLSVFTVSATTTTTTMSGALTGARGQRVDQSGLPRLPCASSAGDQACQPLPTGPGFEGESVVEAVCLLRFSGLRNGTLVKDYVHAGDILRFLSLAWCSACSPSAATDALGAFVVEDSSRVTHLALARTGDSVGDSHPLQSRDKLCTDDWRKKSQTISTAMHATQEQDAHGPAARALAMAARPSMREMLSFPGILAIVPAATHVEIPGFASWSTAVIAYASQLLRGVTTVLCNPSLEENDEVVAHLSDFVYTLVGTGLGLLLSTDESLRKDTRRLMSLLTSCVAREAAAAAELYWTAVERRGQRATPRTLAVSRTTMAITTSRLLQVHDSGQMLAGGAALLIVLTNVQRTIFQGKISRDLRELRSAVQAIIGDLEGHFGARHRDGSGAAAARQVHEHAREPVSVRTNGSGTMEDLIEIIDEDEDDRLVALPPESASAQAFNVHGVDLTHGFTANPVRGGTVPVAGVEFGAAVG
ncbi:hypothetical protein I4F81_011519 [Pyropia yezoensis]|uniref:Uncharacterized protein n=1 Tax=Pyropia yezoensis TaxID=2788 RepID=A0ACC3CGZ7_PYRYE|nr:hypothetical protein I4F81_011519 [Neopyropia yezoensis]